MTKIAFAGTFSAQLAEPVRAQLAMPCDIVLASEANVAAKLGDCDVLVSMEFNREMAAASGRLKLVQVPGAGLDRIDTTALGKGTRLANVYGHEAGIAEYVIGAMITLTREFVPVDAKLRRGIWHSQWAIGRPIPPLLPELGGKTIAILGFGHIGAAIAKRAKAFDMRVVGMRRSTTGNRDDNVDAIVPPSELDALLAEADFVAVTLPLTDQTRNLIDADQFARMKSTARIINVGRGEIVNEDALYDALATGRIAGAAIDVWYRYPTTNQPTLPARRPFHELDNVLMTPHASGWTKGMLDARARVIADNIARAISGEPLLNAITP
jgi:phosphoglycerate dehydrogenase-like enzyme